MEFEHLGWPDEGPTLRLDHRDFSYAGKFVMSSTGKAVARNDGQLVAAVAFNDDRTDPDCLWVRYVTVRESCRGQGLGPRLIAFVVEQAADYGYERVKIAVNNPYAFHALQKAGFRYTGTTTGLAELVLERPTGRPAVPDPDGYRSGLEVFETRDLTDAERSFLEERRQAGPPDLSVVGEEAVDDEDVSEGVERTVDRE